MTRATIILILIFSILTLGAFEIHYVSGVLSTFEDNIECLQIAIEDNRGNLSELYDTVKNAKHDWQKEQDKMSLIYNQKDLHPISEAFVRLKMYIKNNDYENAIVEVELLDSYSEQNRSVLVFNFNNIF